MLTVGLVAVALFSFVLAACVQNPIPASAVDAPPLAIEDSARGRLPAGSGWWPWQHAVSRTLAAHEARLCMRPAARAAFAADPDNRVCVPRGLECPVAVAAPACGGGGVRW